MASRYRPSPSHHSATPTSISELSEIGFDARALDKRIEGAAQPLLRNGTARKLLLAHRIQIAPPCVAVTAPLGMQCLGRHVVRANVKPGATLITDGRGPWVGRGPPAP